MMNGKFYVHRSVKIKTNASWLVTGVDTLAMAADLPDEE